jgi:hypothetical protein
MADTTDRYSTSTNSDVVISLDPNEAVPAGVIRQVGFKLARGQGNRPIWRSEEYNRAELAQQVASQGFSVDPNLLKIGFVKNAWNGDFGAYEERPGQNRPALTIGVDHRRRHPTLGPKQYTAGVGSGQSAFGARVSGAIEFKGNHYVCIAGRNVYRMDNWSGSGEGTAYFTSVFQHSNAGAVLRDLKVYDGVLYVAAGETATYAYSTDGTTWVESTRGAPDDKAEQFAVLNGTLHKIRVPNLHYQTTDGTNGGEAWSNADAIDTDYGNTVAAFEQVGMENQMTFATEEGWFTLDSGGNTLDMYPELKRLSDAGNGFHAFVWNKIIFYPTLHGELMAFKEGRVYEVAPAYKQERVLELSPTATGVFVGRVRAMAGTQKYLYVEIQRASDSLHRIVVLEHDGGTQFTWRTLVDVATTTSDELWITSRSTSGPILWATTATEFGNRAAYWVLPAGPDPLQDTRMRYADSGILYEPWLTFGCPTTKKRPDAVELAYSSNGTGGTITFRLIAEDGTSTQRTITGIDGPGQTVFRLPKRFIHYRYRIQWEYSTTDNDNTPFITEFRMSVFALPEPQRVFHFTVDTQWAGVQDGRINQIQAREFLDVLRGCDYPVILQDQFHDRAQGTNRKWSVITIPPTPQEDHVKEGGHQWDSAHSLTMVEVISREFEIQNPPADDEEPPGEPPILPPSEEGGGASLEIITLALKSNTLYPAWTTDRTAATVQWHFNNTGLPTTLVDHAYLITDPWDIQNKAAIFLHKSTGTVEIWYNSAYRTAGNAWTKVFDVATWNTLTSQAAGTIAWSTNGARQHGLWASIASQDYWAFQVRNGTDVRVVHTHNSFSSFTITAAAINDDEESFTLGQWDEAFAFHEWNSIINFGNNWVISRDGGHTFTVEGDEQFPAGNFPISFLLPYHNNAAYQELLIIASGGGANGEIYRNTSGFQTPSTSLLWGTVTGMGSLTIGNVHGVRLDPINGQRMIIAASTSLQHSNDRGRNWAASPVTIPGGAMDAALWPGGGMETAIISNGVLAGTNFVFYTEDLATFTDLTGNYGTAVVAVDGGLIGHTVAFGKAQP